MAKIGFNLSDYWLILRKRKWVAVVCFLVVFLSAIFHMNIQKPSYKAVCSIRMVERKSVSDMITQMVSYTSYDLMMSLSKVLVGRPIVEKVVYELGLADENTPIEELNNIILKIQNSARAENELGTNIASITVEYPNAQMAAKIANTIAQVFIKADTDEKSEQARKIRIFLEERSAESKQRLTDAEDKLKFFREKGEATGIATVIQNNIAALEKQKIELKKIYTDKYPDVITIDQQIVELNKELQALPESELEYARLTRELQVIEQGYRLLQSRLEGARIAEAERVEDVKIVNPAMVPKSPIKPNKKVATSLGLVIGIVVGLFMSFVVETLDTSIGTIDDLETLLKLPVLAVIPYMKPLTRHRSWLPWLRPWQILIDKTRPTTTAENIEIMKQQLLIKFSQKSSATEAYRILRTNIKVDDLIKADQRVLLVTSTIPKEGKSITALNLALALAQDGYKTLLIDCDLRKAVLHKVFNINKDPGLSDVLLGSITHEKATRNLVDMMISDPQVKDLLSAPGLDNFQMLTCGKIVVNPAELLDSTKIEELINNLKKKYNFIVLDSPPVLPVPDTMILGKKVADKVYMIYRAGYTSKVAILRAKEQLDIMKISPTGIILNSTTPESQIVSDYYHHYYHYRYYTEKED